MEDGVIRYHFEFSEHLTNTWREAAIRWRHIGAISRRSRQTSTAVIMIIVDCIVVSAEQQSHSTHATARHRGLHQNPAPEDTPGPRTLTPAGPANRPPPRAADHHSQTVADGIGAVLGRDARPTTYSRHLSDDGAQSRRPLTHIWESSWTELRGRRMHVRKMAKTKNAGTKNGMDEKWQTKSAWTKNCVDENMHRRKNIRTKKCTDEKI